MTVETLRCQLTVNALENWNQIPAIARTVRREIGRVGGGQEHVREVGSGQTEENYEIDEMLRVVCACSSEAA